MTGTLFHATFTVPGRPIAKGRPRRGKNGVMFTPARTRAAEASFAEASLAWRPVDLPTGPIKLTLCFVFAIPSTWPKWKKAAAKAGHVFHKSVPDVDNLVKLAKDALNGLFWVDDAQVVEVLAIKAYGLVEQTAVCVQELPEITERAQWVQRGWS